MNKKQLSERDICSKFITPSLVKNGWDINTQIREEFPFTSGQVFVRGKKIFRGKRKRVDYLLSLKQDFPLALIEVKENNHNVGDGMQQALDYAESLDIPFVFSTNGDAYLFHDKTAQDKPEKEIKLEDFPSPDFLYNKFLKWKNFKTNDENIILNDFYSDQDSKDPRYYQRIAINKTIEAIEKDKKKILLVLATGTGKTFVAFQIIWKLWKAKKKKRILYLADRNILIDQTITNDFKPFGDKMHKIKNRNADKAYEIYLSLYQAITGTEEDKKIFKQFSRDFFDLVIIDECHRGSAAEDSFWREILEYFDSATQIGMTATPKETKDISNINYFGEPIYSYTLKQGILDGFLAPYKVIRVTLDKDVEGYRPQKGEVDKSGNLIPDKVYKSDDFEKNIVIDERTELVAKKISEYMKNSGDRYMKTIVFCVDIEHAERMRRALVNENNDLVKLNQKYIVRITGDNEIGKSELDNFIDPVNNYPVIATTSRLMSTGVDAQTCKLIVLDKEIASSIEFKQIIGRGTRLRPDFNKNYFTILDFRRATDKFADPDFDGEPIVIYEAKDKEKIQEPSIISDVNKDNQIDIKDEKDKFLSKDPTFIENIKKEKRDKIYINNVEVKVLNEQVSFLNENGELITKSIRDFSKENILKKFKTMDNFLNKWSESDKKKAFISELESEGILLEDLKEEVGEHVDTFDLILHIAYGRRLIARKERAERIKNNNYFKKYSSKARIIIDSLIDKYADQGIEHIEDPEIFKVKPFEKIGTPVEIMSEIGGIDGFNKIVGEINNNLYS